MFLNKPIIYFIYDIDHYLKQCRGFYFDIEYIGGQLVAKDYKELCEKMRLVDKIKIDYRSKLKLFHDNQGKQYRKSLMEAIKDA